jgi:hypothetical protein
VHAHQVESSYRAALASGWVDALDDSVYEEAMARMMAAWLLWTLFRRLSDASADRHPAVTDLPRAFGRRPLEEPAEVLPGNRLPERPDR